MIFKHLFTPKFKHTDPKVRQEAIASLSPDNVEQKGQLHELAFNDEDANVNLAALTQLNSFALWNKTAETSRNERVRKKAEATVERTLMGEGSVEISHEERRTFVLECTSNSLLEKLLRQPWVEQDNGLTLHILKTVNKPHLTQQTFFRTKNEALQQTLIAGFDDESTLTKVVRKSPFKTVVSTAQSTLDKIKRDKTLPASIEKQARLVLSQLLALKEKHDFGQIKTAREQLQAQFEAVSADFTLLSEEMRDSLNEKYADICARLDGLALQLAPEWEKQQQKEHNSKAIEDARQTLKDILENVALSLASGAQEITLGQVEKYENALENIETGLNQLSSAVPSEESNQHKALEALFNQLNSCRATLERLPEFQQAIETANQMLAALRALPLPQEIGELDAAVAHMKDQRKAWKALSVSHSQGWPQSLQKEWKVEAAKWQQQIDELTKQLKSDEHRCKNKLRAIDNMVSQGRFKPAMGLFKKVSSWYNALPEKQQASLNRQYDKVKAQVENLKDWQEYIAQPRKPALLEEAEGLVNSPLEARKQADAVKRLRKEWNSLGNAESEADNALNKAFEMALENAFEPCREFYAKQQDERAANLSARQQVIQQLQDLVNLEMSEVEYAQAFYSLQNKWHQIGEVDFDKRDAQNKAFRSAIKPVKKKVEGINQHNKDTKLLLIKRAAALTELEDVEQAVERAKNLQEEWKQTGSAGRKEEKNLWDAFRAENDKVFAQRKAQWDTVRQEVDDKISELKDILTRLDKQLQDATDIQSTNEALKESEQANALIDVIPGKLRGKYNTQLTRIHERQEQKLSKLRAQQEALKYQLLFTSLSEWTDSTLPQSLENIAPAWRNCMLDGKHDGQDNRQNITIRLEILADKTSPENEAELRQKIQLQMMADKLQQGLADDREQLLKSWIKQGPLNSNDRALLERIERVFISA